MRNQTTRQFLESTISLFVCTSVFCAGTLAASAQVIAPPALLTPSFLTPIAPDLIHLDTIPFARKKPDFGGETCIAMYLQSLGHKVTADEVFDAADVDPLLGRGCVAPELAVAAKQLG